RAAAAIFSMTCSIFFSLLWAVSVRQVDIASKAALTALRASSDRPGADIGLKPCGVTSADLFCIATSPLTDRKATSGGTAWTKKHPASVVILSHGDVMQL